MMVLLKVVIVLKIGIIVIRNQKEHSANSDPEIIIFLLSKLNIKFYSAMLLFWKVQIKWIENYVNISLFQLLVIVGSVGIQIHNNGRNP